MAIIGCIGIKALGKRWNAEAFSEPFKTSKSERFCKNS